MGKKIKIIIGACVWAVIGVITAAAIIPSCSEKEPIAEKPSEDGLLLNDDLVAIKEDDGNITIKNTETGDLIFHSIMILYCIK